MQWIHTSPVRLNLGLSSEQLICVQNLTNRHFLIFRPRCETDHRELHYSKQRVLSSTWHYCTVESPTMGAHAGDKKLPMIYDLLHNWHSWIHKLALDDFRDSIVWQPTSWCYPLLWEVELDTEENVFHDHKDTFLLIVPMINPASTDKVCRTDLAKWCFQLWHGFIRQTTSYWPTDTLWNYKLQLPVWGMQLLSDQKRALSHSV